MKLKFFSAFSVMLLFLLFLLFSVLIVVLFCIRFWPKLVVINRAERFLFGCCVLMY